MKTRSLEIFYEEGGPSDGPAVLLLHGWPDSARGWRPAAEFLQARGYRTIAPYLRGVAPTRFLSDNTPRYAAPVALAQDAIDLADELSLDRIAVVGHDWGARAANTMAALFPDRLSAIVTLSTPYSPHGVFTISSFEEARRYWYQWFQCIDHGVENIRKDPVGFARIQWETWSPEGWFEEEEFAATAESFHHPDWVATTLSGYRFRWLPSEPRDPAFDDLQKKVSETETLSTPTLMLQGDSDGCDMPAWSEGREKYFTGGYRRILIEGAGHFLHREAPQQVAEAVIEHLSQTIS